MNHSEKYYLLVEDIELIFPPISSGTSTVQEIGKCNVVVRPDLSQHNLCIFSQRILVLYGVHHLIGSFPLNETSVLENFQTTT